ncbi:MAG TPA: DUF1304 domain-containing protein [Actinomycetales bacterium]
MATATIIAGVLSVLAGVLHVGVFAAESLWWRRPQVWPSFGVRTQDAADAAVFFTFNQGFYNLFLALGALAGPLCLLLGEGTADTVGWTLLVYACASMTTAAAVLRLGCGPSYTRPATIQAVFPTLALLAALVVAMR